MLPFILDRESSDEVVTLLDPSLDGRIRLDLL
jgi:hypothetical protein